MRSDVVFTLSALTHTIVFASVSTVKRRRKEIGLHGSGATMKTIDPSEAEQLVVKALDKDPAKRSGVRTIHQKVAFDDGIHLTRYSDMFFSHL